MSLVFILRLTSCMGVQSQSLAHSKMIGTWTHDPEEALCSVRRSEALPYLPAAETRLSTVVQDKEIAAGSRQPSRSGSLGFSGQDVNPLQTSGFLDV